MAPLFASRSAEEPYYRRISSRASFLYALLSAFMSGAEMVRIAVMVRDRPPQDDLVLEVTYLVLWLAFGLRWGRGAWEGTKQSVTQTKQGGTA